jgi:hypothetical protein
MEGDDWAVSGGRMSLKFDAAAEHTTHGDSDVLNFAHTDSFTVCLWFRTTASTGNDPLVSKMLNSGTFRGWELALESGFLRLYLISTFPASYMLCRSSASGYNDGAWRHLAVTYNGTGSSSGVNFSVNGIVVAKSVLADSLSATLETTASFNINARSGSLSPTPTNIDDVRVYRRVLSHNEIRLLASRRGIAYETNRNRQYNSAATAARLCNIFTGNSLEIIGAP